MRKSLITLLLLTGLIAQGGFTIVGGLNMGNIKYNDSDLADLIDISIKMGLSHLSKKTHAFFVCLGDMPMINHNIYNKLIGLKLK